VSPAAHIGLAAASVATFVATLEGVLALLHARRARAGPADPSGLPGEDTNAYLRELRALTPASAPYVETLFPHPYLGWVHHGNPPGGIPGVNNVGLLGQDFPCEKDPAAFTILLTGGSVACQFAQNVAGGPRYLEEELNGRYTTGDGRRFVVLNGAAGAWKQPQQAILFLQHADAVDAVVTLDGWNEHYLLAAAQRLEYPASNFHLVNPLATQSHRQLVGIWLAGGLEGWLRRHPWLARSRALGALVRALRRALWRRLVARPGPGGTRRTSLESIFALPADWDLPRRFQHAVRSYAKYVLAIHAVAARWGVRTAHFLQPVPAIGKVLTAEERAVVGDLGYHDRYAAMVEKLLGLRRVGVPIFSLTDLFGDCAETIYADAIHLARDARTLESRGNRLLAARVAALVAEAWGLRPREGVAVVAPGLADEPPRVLCMLSEGAAPDGAAATAEAIAAGAAGRPMRIVCRRGGEVSAAAAVVHLFHLDAESTRRHAERARALGVPYVVSALHDDRARHALEAEALFRAYRVRLGLAPAADDDAWRGALERDGEARRARARLIAVGAARLVATGESEAERIARDFPGLRAVIIPAAVPAPGGADRDAFVARYGTRDFVLAVGRIEPGNNQLVLLHALADDPVDVVLATGGQTTRPDYLEACRAFRRRGRTLYLPYLTDAELAAAYALARVHVLPSFCALPGLTTLEALAAGCPAVASDRGTLRDHLGDTVPYAPPGDPAALGAAIEAARGWSFGAARARVTALTAARAADAWCALYAEALGAGRGAAAPAREPAPASPAAEEAAS
jgi:glycosyltransferase involved in cell wall biosynthesis